MCSDDTPPVPIGYAASGEPRLFAQALTAAQLTDPGERWSVLRPPDEDHPQAAGLLDRVVFPTTEVGYVRASDGLLLKTADGGATWTWLRHDLPSPAAALAFPSPTVGYLGVRRVRLLGATGQPVFYEACMRLGTAHTLLRTVDGGRTWRLLTPLVDAPLPKRNRAFLPQRPIADAAALAAQLEHSPEHLQGLPGTVGYLRQVAFPSTEVGYALVDPAVSGPSDARMLLRTADRGQTWYVCRPPDEMRADPGVRSLCVWGPGELALATREALRFSVDGGTTWEARDLSPVGLGAFLFPTPQRGYALARSRYTVVRTPADVAALQAEERAVFRTDDGGRKWKQVGAVVAERLLLCPHAEVVLAVAGQGRLQRSADGGRTWREAELGAPYRPMNACCPDGQTCYAVAGRATILKSADGGAHWRVLTAGIDALYAALGAAPLAVAKDEHRRG
jgi:photosystem II stability/assembly factor-like uncharacterized protein